MKPRFIFWTVSLVVALLAVACASAPQTQLAPVAESTLPPAEVAATLTPTFIPAVQPVATSRGPNLEATNPATVALASGQLQLIEFFRFT
ncbi:MAG TPA: hypothetical protein PKL78_03250 [Anaerolineales bacterium]|nr:hypothetical protein [Anaerolineales bacterium]HNO30342.1 hypothetical protein [Anaerolineales bacterium]